MRILSLTVGLLVFWVALSVGAEKQAGPPEGLKPGVVSVFFDDEDFRRPANHGADKGIKNHGKPVAVTSPAVDQQIDLEVEGAQGYSQLWIGRLRFPAAGEITFSTEVDNAMRLFVGGKPVLDAGTGKPPAEGKVRVEAGQELPLRVEYVQSGGPSLLRLFWQWEGQPRTAIPASAFWHGEKDLQLARDIVAGTRTTSPDDTAVVAPSPDAEDHSSIYGHTTKTVRGDEPIRLAPGPHLFIDDYLVAECERVKRRVNCPRRDPKIPNPLVTGKEDECVAPYMAVIRDPETKRFRIWYNPYKAKFGDGSARFALMESDDGIHWIRPHRVLPDPGPINFGCSVLDEGPSFADPARRYKLAWWNDGGMKIAVSPDGVGWEMLSPRPVIRHNHDINNLFRDTLRDCYVATLSVYIEGPTWKGLRRCSMQTRSKDLLQWEKPWFILRPDDSLEPGETQFYSMQGHLIRGGLWIGLVKVLHDDWKAPGTPEGAFGVGYTTLAWTRDGTNWVRDLEPFFEPDGDPNAWDHAHAWMDYQLPMGDDVRIYYGGYKYGHKMDRWEGRQIGMVAMRRDRYVSRDAGSQGGTLRTPPVVIAGSALTVNAEVNGELRARLLDASGKPLAGFDLADCEAIHGDSLAHAVRWKKPLGAVGKTPVRIEFVMKDSRLYALDVAP